MRRARYISPIFGVLALWACDSGGGASVEADMQVDAEREPEDVGAVDAGAVSCILDDDCEDAEYCRAEGDGGLSGVCAAGCRLEPDTCAEADAATVCDPETRACAQRPCESDAECAEGDWCDEGACVEGCRPDPDTCAADDPATACDPERRVCVALQPCCADEVCTLTRPDACAGQTLESARGCTPNPCLRVACDADVDCATREYCDGDGRCADGCRLDDSTSCDDDLVCQPDRRECAALSCAEDAECPAWQYCDGARCRQGCRLAEDACEAPARCDPDARVCRVFCADDDECDGGYCDPVLDRCRPLCEPATHAGCGVDEACDEASRRCRPGCRDDAAELDGGDDDVGTAVVLAPPTEAADRAACPGDPDLFQVQLAAGERLQARLRYDPSEGRLALRVRDPAGTLVAEDGSLTAPKRLRAPGVEGAGEDGAWSVEVSGVELGDRVAYALEVDAVGAGGCFADARDPGDDSEAGALRVGLRPLADFTETLRGDLCPGDEDWVCFPMNQDDGLDVTLFAPAGCDPLAAELYARGRLRAQGPGEPDYVALAPVGVEGGRQYRLDVDPESGGFTTESWCLRVRAADEGGQCEDYGLTLGFHRRGAVCTDQVEPNDTLDVAVELDGDGPLADPQRRLPEGLDLEVPRNLEICEGDLDLFSLRANAGDALRAWAVEDGLEGDVVVRFLDARGEPRGDPAGLTEADAEAPEQALALAAAEGLFHIQVSGVDASAGGYRLFVRRDAADGLCANDLSEPEGRDDEAVNASELRSIEPTRLAVRNAAVCHPDDETLDEDWYRFAVPRNRSRLCVNAGFRHRDGDLDMQLFRRVLEGEACGGPDDCEGETSCVEGRCQAPLVSASTANDGEFISLAKEEVSAGTYLLRVFGPVPAGAARGEENSYDLTVTMMPPEAPCVRDWREREGDNDDIPTATPLGSGRASVCDAWLCHAERNTGDWYALQIPPGADRTVHLGYAPRSDGTLLLTYINPEDPAGIVESNELQTNVQCLNIEGGEAPATVYVGVSADAVVDDGDDRVDYLLQVVPTDLARFPRGECDGLSGGVFQQIDWPTARVP